MNNMIKLFFIVFATALIFMIFSFTRNNSEIEQNNRVVGNNEHLVMAVLFEQKSAEFSALCYQAYNTAKVMIEKRMETKSFKKNKCIVVDVDETVLDNSPFETKCIVEGTSYPKYWKEWVDLSSAKPIPGSVDFLNYAKTKGIETFYVTNRSFENRESTIKNLIKFGFPYADTIHILTKNDKNSSKEIRRKKISEKYEILLLIGDNLADFSALYDNQPVNKRFSITDSLRNEFGNSFIIIPNAMYGDWENALYNYNYKLTDQEKDAIRKENLINF